MDIQISKTSLPSDGPTAVRAAPLPEPGAGRKTAAPPPDAAAQPSSIEAAGRAARQINDFLQSSNSNIEFSVDGDSNKVIVRVIDSQTRHVIRQIPSEEMLAIARSLDQMTGLRINQTA